MSEDTMAQNTDRIKTSSTTCSRWIAVCVDMLDHPVVGMSVAPPKPADDGRHAIAPMIAWQDLIASAAFAAKPINHKGVEIVLERGQFLAGRAYWAKRWNWGEQSVRSFFSRLVDRGMIAISNQSDGHLANVASVCNYDTYQSRKADAKPDKKPEPNQSLTSGQPEPNQTLTRDTKVTNINTPHGARETDADKLNREAYERGMAIKGGAVAKSARAEQRTKGELDGSAGIRFANGRLEVFNGAAAELAAAFPGVDIAAVCNKAAPDLSRMSYPSRDDALAVLRRHCQFAVERGGAVPAGGQPRKSALQILDEMETANVC